MSKYYYQHGTCEANHYLSFNPVMYEPTEKTNTYKKSKMDCRMVLDGKCNRAETCQLLKDAPGLMKYDKINLRYKKLDE